MTNKVAVNRFADVEVTLTVNCDGCGKHRTGMGASKKEAAQDLTKRLDDQGWTFVFPEKVFVCPECPNIYNKE
jgi:hypothetical protein